MIKDNCINAFFALIRAGLWEQDVTLSQFGEVNFAEVLRIAEEQSVVGLVAAGLEHVVDVSVPKDVILQFVGQALQLEQQNKAMNSFVATLVGKMRKADIYTLLLKGQGIAQCYERPLWRSCGDVDLFLNEDNYLKAKVLLTSIASSIDHEYEYQKHLGFVIEQWAVELHGNLRSDIFNRIDKVLDDIKDDTFYGGNVRSWMNGPTPVFLLCVNNDIIYVFTHILDHFFHGGIGLRQICDWCRLIWTFRDTIGRDVLENRLRAMGLMNEWRAFASLAVDSLGMPCGAMPIYSDSNNWKRKGKKILSFVLDTGNFGHNRDKSYIHDKSVLRRKINSFWRHTTDSFVCFFIFPYDSIKVWLKMLIKGIKEII